MFYYSRGRGDIHQMIVYKLKWTRYHYVDLVFNCSRVYFTAVIVM